MGVAGDITAAAQHTDRSVQPFTAPGESMLVPLPPPPVSFGFQPGLGASALGFSVSPAWSSDSQGPRDLTRIPIFRPGLGTQSLQLGIPRTAEWPLKRPFPHSLPLAHGRKFSSELGDTEDRGGPCTCPLARVGAQTIHSQPALS